MRLVAGNENRCPTVRESTGVSDEAAAFMYTQLALEEMP